MKKAFIVASCLFAVDVSSAYAQLTLVTSSAALDGNDHIFWGHVGPSGSTATNPFNIESYGGIPVTVSQASLPQFDVSVQVPLGSNPYDPIPNGFYGDFSPGDYVLSTGAGGGTGPLTLTFGDSVSAVGTQIESFFPVAFTAQIQAFNADGVSLGSFTESGVVSPPFGNDSAIFLGVESTSQDIASVQFSITSLGSADFYLSINQVLFSSTFSVPGTYPDSIGGVVPEPSSIVLLGVSLAGSLLAFGAQKWKCRR